MKAERRHELQTNSLAAWLSQVPDFLQKYGSKLLTLVILILVVLVGLRLYRSSAAEKQAKLLTELANVRSSIADLERRPRALVKDGLGLEDAADIRQKLASIAKDADEPVVKAEAALRLGDVWWAVANYPNLAFAEEQEALAEAAKAYQTVITDHPQQPVMVTSAHLGLAAVAENRAYLANRQGQDPGPLWTEARNQYEAVVNDAQAPPVLRDWAKTRRDDLTRLQEPIVTIAAKPLPTQPATEPTGALGPALPKPATKAATGAAAIPAPRPATRPTTR